MSSHHILKLISYTSLEVIRIKKVFKIIGMSSLICLSFIFTEKTVSVVKDVDSIMVEIKEKSDSYKKEAVNAIIKDNTIIPGLSGHVVDVNKSYEKMKRYGSFLESLLEYKKINPSITMAKNYDKYVISGNPLKNMVSLLFLVEKDDDIEPYIKRLEKTNTKATFFLDGTWFENNNSKVLELMEKYEVGNLSYNRNYEDSSFVWMDTIIKKVGKQSQSYCYAESENKDSLLICSMNKNYTIMPNIVLKSEPLKEIKENLKAGSIIAIPLNKNTLEDISSIIHFIESKGYTIETLSEHLIE